MTQIYFIRHSVPDLSIKDDLLRPLTIDGINKANELVKLFENIQIDKIYSSPYKRTLQTLEPISVYKNMNINIIEDFRERKISNDWIDNFNEYCKNQWEDFSYKLENGESLSEVQFRNVQALNKILVENSGKIILIGTHGTALSTIINFYDNTYQYDEFMKIVGLMPYIIKFEFNDKKYIKRLEINIL
jgi:2,3-bisphosphoglycerate-dependent phosphoglycerate mutase